MSLLHKALAYFNCSFRIELSYRFALGISILGALVNLLIFFFIDKLFGAQINPHLADYGINYFAYVLVAIATSSFIGTTLA